jgi:hypothetical protein
MGTESPEEKTFFKRYEGADFSYPEVVCQNRPKADIFDRPLD